MSNVTTSTEQSYSLSDRVAAYVGREWLIRLASVATILIIWELWASRPDVITMAPPSEVVYSFIDYMFINQELLWAIYAALQYTVVGYLIAVVMGVFIGFLIGFWAPARHVINPILDALYVTPLVAFVPLIIIWFGVGTTGKMVFVFLFAFFEIAVNTSSGVTETPEGLVDAAKVFGADTTDIYTRVHLRHAIPHVFSGLRLGGGRATRGMVVAELFIAAGALGQYLVNAGALFQISKLFAGVAALSILGVIVISAIRIIESRLLAYRDVSG
ncbi:MAG: ABC transporter permease [Haloarculaceae archaeon]